MNRHLLLLLLLVLGLTLTGCSVSSTSTTEVSASYSVTGGSGETDAGEDAGTSEAYIDRDYLLDTYPWAAAGEGSDGCVHYLLYDSEDVTRAMLFILDEEGGYCTFAEGPADWDGADLTIHDTEEDGAFITLTVTDSQNDGLQVSFQDDTTAVLNFTDAEETIDQILDLLSTCEIRPLLP